jgi:AraC family transcriptional regulator of adaptative response / DNA-3-methyladenine glycosylase II
LHTGWIRVAPDDGAHALRVTVSDTLLPAAPAVLRRVRRLFDLEADPAEIAARLGALAASSPGLRLPGAFDPFEMAVRAILGQQITVKAARTLAGRFAQAFGMPLDAPDAALRTLFPSAATVADASIDAIASLGIVSARAQAIRALARAVCDGTLSLEPTADVSAQLDRLRALPGIGEWTAQYLAMRALGWPDAFPHTDYGVRKALGTTSDREVLAQAEAWRPWRAYAVMHLWRSLAETP